TRFFNVVRKYRKP
ncbi:hypothetical protein D027_4693B, partial [Vibrio parahaemolyticus 861]